MVGIKNRGSQIHLDRTKYKRQKIEHEIQESIEDNDVEETLAMPDDVHYRDFQVESGDKESMTVEMSVSSEAPVTRNWGGVEGIEVLDHSPDSIDLTRFERGAAPLLLDHDPTKQVGVIDSIRLDQSQRKLRATARFGNSSLLKETYADVVDICIYFFLDDL